MNEKKVQRIKSRRGECCFFAIKENVSLYSRTVQKGIHFSCSGTDGIPIFRFTLEQNQKLFQIL